MTVEPTTLLHGAMIALLATSTLGSFAASYVFWVVKGPTPAGCAAPCSAQPLSTSPTR